MTTNSTGRSKRSGKSKNPDSDGSFEYRTRLLASILQDPRQWRNWLVEHPRRLADLLGVCDDGRALIETDLSPLLARSLLLNNAGFLTGGAHMAENPNPAVPANNDYVQLANTLLNLLTIGLREKKKVDKLNALVTAYQQCCEVKDALIEKYENGNVTAAKKKLAKDIRKKLLDLQKLLKEIQDDINNSKDASAKIIQAAALTGEIRAMLSNL